jgi:hypothetical protein
MTNIFGTELTHLLSAKQYYEGNNANHDAAGTANDGFDWNNNDSGNTAGAPGWGGQAGDFEGAYGSGDGEAGGNNDTAGAPGWSEQAGNFEGAYGSGDGEAGVSEYEEDVHFDDDGETHVEGEGYAS